MKVYRVVGNKYDYTTTLFGLLQPLDIAEAELDQISSLAVGEQAEIEDGFTITRIEDNATITEQARRIAFHLLPKREPEAYSSSDRSIPADILEC